LIVWRVYDPAAAHALLPSFDPFDGRGAALYPGRWNDFGVPMVYTSASPSLAILETAVHTGLAAFGVRALLEIDVPDGLPTEDAAEGIDISNEDETQRLGGAWARSGRSLALRVPSRVVPVELNVLLNPRHPAMAQVRVVWEVPIALDARLLAEGAKGK